MENTRFKLRLGTYKLLCLLNTREPASFESSISLNLNFSEGGNLPARVSRIRLVQSDFNNYPSEN